jgi:hypothetical protein
MPQPQRAPAPGALAALAPHALRFGTLRAGRSYEADVYLHNLSPGLLRFRGGRAHAGGKGGANNAVSMSHEAGPLARGMSRALTVRVTCRREGVVSEVVQVVLPGEELALPVAARVVAAGEPEQLALGVRVCADDKPSYA